MNEVVNSNKGSVDTPSSTSWISWISHRRSMESSTQCSSPRSCDDLAEGESEGDDEGTYHPFDNLSWSELSDTKAIASLAQDQILILDENVELTKQLDSVKAEKHSLQLQLVDTREELDSTRSNLQQQIECLQSELLSLKENFKLSDMLSPPAANGTSIHFHSAQCGTSKEEFRTVKGHLQKSMDRQALLEEELATARAHAIATNEQLEELKLQNEQIRMEVQAAEFSTVMTGTNTQVTLLERTELAQRVFQLLTINGKFRSSVATLRSRIELRDSNIEALKQDAVRAKNDEMVNEVVLQRQILEWQHRAHSLEHDLKKAQRSQAATKNRSLACDSSRLELCIKELESENEILLEQQKKRQYNWDHQKTLMRQNISSLEERVQELESQINFSLEANEKRDQPPNKFSCRDDNAQRKDIDHPSLRMLSPCPVTPDKNHAHSGVCGSTSACSISHERLEQVEAKLREKEASEVALTEQLSELSRATHKAQQDAAIAEERVHLLQECLEKSLAKRPSKDRELEEKIIHSLTSLEKQQQSLRKQSEQMHQRLQLEKANMIARRKTRLENVRALDHNESVSEIALYNSIIGRCRPTLPLKDEDDVFACDRVVLERQTTEECRELLGRCDNLEQQCSTLGIANMQLQASSADQVSEISKLEAQLRELEKKNDERAETIVALEKIIEEMTVEFDVNQGEAADVKDTLQTNVSTLLMDKEELTDLLSSVQEQATRLEGKIAELNAEKVTLEKESQSFSKVRLALLTKVDAQENDLAVQRDQLVLLEKESAEQVDRISILQSENELLRGEIDSVSEKLRNNSIELSASLEELKLLKHELKSSREAFSNQQSEDDELSSSVEKLGLNQKQSAEERVLLLQRLEDATLLQADLNVTKDFLESSLAEANDNQRQLEDSLASTKGDLAEAKADILSLLEEISTIKAEAQEKQEEAENRLHDLPIQLSKFEMENASLRQAYVDKEKQLSDMLVLCKRHEDRIESVTDELNERQLHIQNLNAEKLELKTDFNLTKDFLESSLAEANDNQRQLEDSIASTKGDLAEARAEILSLWEELSTIKAEAQEKQEEAENRLHDLPVQLSKLKMENASLRQAYVDKEKQLSDMLVLCKRHEERIESLTNESNELQLHIQNLNAQKLELKNEGDRRFEASCEQLEDLESLVHELQNELVILENERDDFATKVDTQQQCIDSFLSQLSHLEVTPQFCQRELMTSHLRVRALEETLKVFEAECHSSAPMEMTEK